MPRLPDRFDLWVRQARTYPDPERQLDYVLGALVTLTYWFFLNAGTEANPQPAVGGVENLRALLVFSDAGRVSELADFSPPGSAEPAPQIITIPSEAALTWCIQDKPGPCDALLINPGDDAALIPLERVVTFAREWQARDALKGSGFWIPNLVSEEEDFWREHGL